MRKYLVIAEEDNTWFSDVETVDDLLREYQEENLDGPMNIEYIYELKDVTPPNLKSFNINKTTNDSSLEKPLPSWWDKGTR